MSLSVRDQRVMEARMEGSAEELRAIRDEAERLRILKEALDATNIQALLPTLNEMRESAMQSLMDADDLNQMLRYQGEARAYALLASKPGEIQQDIDRCLAEAAHIRERMEAESRADAGFRATGNAGL